ncbi:filamentous hemagglutinin N-terminal domain-containing protein [Undibacterium sp. Di27W]|uniref:two-partner secretion domain-containing protein n=1 Tax=Undibacterium sp. Di27W TaxID=3413036 RepID=UPI003BF32FB9
MRKEIDMFAQSVSVLRSNTRENQLSGLLPKLLPRLMPVLLAACFSTGLVASLAHANPVGPQVINGRVIFSQDGKVFTITNTPGAIINWQDFFINGGETTRFIQESANSTVLNRVIGQNPTQILGALQSNGRVFLINPNGILFGKGAQVDVNGLTVSSLGMTDADFKAGRLNFNAGTLAGKVSNQGAITTPAGGQVYLIAPDIENSGIITSPKGEVLLAAGRSVKLVDSANPDVHVVVSADNNQALNLGQIVAQGGKVGIYGGLISQRGLVSANSAVVGENGKIYFKASQDTILDTGSVTTATGKGQGGDIQILGQRVALAGNAKVDASGNTGGGQVLVGGDYHGDNSAIMNAKRAFVGSDAKISADALKTGDGGKVIVWSDDVTRVNGSISAQGGALGGNGGFVETSGKQNLDFHARVNVGAARGKAGTLLLDPSSITIAGGTGDGASDGSSSFQGSAIGTINFADASPTTVYQSELQGLSPGTNIVLEATNFINTSGTFFGSSISLPSNSNITLRTRNASTDVSATRGINLTGADPNLEIKTSGFGTITLQTGTGVSPQTADIVVAKLTTNSSQISTSASGNTTFKTLLTTPSAVGVGGDVVLNSTGYINVGTGGVDARGNSSANGNVTITTGSDITQQNGSIIYAKDLKLSAVSGLHGNISTDSMGVQAAKLNAINTGSGDIRIASIGANLVINDVGGTGYGIKQQTSGTAIHLSSPTGFTTDINSPVITNNGMLNINGQGGINLNAGGSINSAGGSVNLLATDTNVLTNTAAGTQINSAGADISIKSDKMDLQGAVNAGSGAVTLDSNTAGTIHLATGASNALTGTLELSAAELNNVTATRLKIGNMSGGSIDIKGAMGSGAGGALQNVNTSLTLNSGNTISQQAGATIDGASSVQARGYSVNLSELNFIGVVSGSASTGSFLYRSSNPISISTVDGYSGISSGSTIKLTSDSTSGISQATGNAIIGSGLALQTKGSVNLSNTSNSFSSLAADLNPGGQGTGSLNIFNAGNLTISNIASITGITTNNQAVTVSSGTGTLTVSDNVNAGTGKVGFIANQLTLGGPGGVTAGDFGVRPFTAGRAITIGSATCTVAPCLAVTNLYKVSAANIAIGTDDVSNASGAISVVGITDTNTSAITDIKHLTTTRIGLISGGAISQVNPITVQDLGVVSSTSVTLNSPNVITSLAGKSAGSFSLVNSQGINVASLSGSNGSSSYSLGGINTTGNIYLTASSGNILLSSNVSAGTGAVTLSASGGAISQTSGNLISGAALDATANGGIGNSGGLKTQVPLLLANNTGSNTDIKINNTGALNLQNVQQSSAGSTGNILIDNIGAITLNSGDAVRTKAGNISLVAHSPLTVNGTVASANGGNITLEAGASGSTADKLTVGSTGSVTTSGNILLKAGDAILISGTVSGGTVTQQAFQNVPLPTLDQCLSSPTTPGCSSVLPSLSACISNPNLVGCSVVLPSVAACQASPTLAGCSVVLPSLTACLANPSMFGCSNVLPSASACQANPNLPGCSAVLPTLASCLVNPSTPGCSSVLPSLNSCISNASLTGCSVVLPSLSQCISSPSTAGCSVVLPALAACLVSPNIAGCSAVLPSVAACTASPSLPGCSSVLPSLSACISNSSLAGCSAVLPTLSACLASPSLSGCSAVLPSLSACIRNTSLPGCSAILPTLAACTANPSLSGCSAVLPSLSACISNNSLAGCSAVLPTLAACTASPSLPGCSAVLPSLSACVANPSLSGCNNVLPTLTACLSNPSLPGCSAVLPSLAACTANPALSGCSAVLPTLAACQASPSLPGCAAVLPSLSACIANPALPACASVLPTLAACVASPSLPGCSAVLPSLNACVANPGLSGCSAVLPTLAACSAAPSLTGCSAVLPSLTACTATPTLAGCSAVLPSLAACSASPSLPGCSAVLPSLAACIATPGLPGCSTILPGLATCTAAPSTPGCSAVLPSLTACTANPALAGCGAVLPSLAACTANPASPGCAAVLPGLSACIANPGLPGCSVVLPTLATCTATPFVSGCSAVLPSLAACVANPSTPGCSAVLPALASCAANPALSGCAAVLPTQAQCAANPGLLGCTLVLPIGDLRTGNTLNNSINFALNSFISSTLAITNSINNTANFFESGSSDSGRETRLEQRSSIVGTRDNGVLKNATDKKLYCN